MLIEVCYDLRRLEVETVCRPVVKHRRACSIAVAGCPIEIEDGNRVVAIKVATAIPRPLVEFGVATELERIEPVAHVVVKHHPPRPIGVCGISLNTHYGNCRWLPEVVGRRSRHEEKLVKHSRITEAPQI